MTYVYIITRVLTYFGTELRTFFEHIACRIHKVAIEDSRSFKSSEMCGHIEHELTKSLASSFLICFLPFFMNFVLGCLMLLTGSFRVFYIGEFSFVGILFLWVGISLLSNCSPSFEDALSLKDNLYKKETNLFAKIILSPFFAVVYAFSWLERYSLTFVLSIAFAVVFPELVSIVFPLLSEIILR